jgi:hypothetical protein
MTSLALTEAGPIRPPAVDYKRELEGAKMLLRSGLLPTSVKSPEAALFIILAGRDLGLSPVQSLRSINIIQGKVEVSADMSLGLFHRAGGKSHFVKLTDSEAVLRFSAPWLLQDHEESFTIKDAERAGLLARQDNWKKFPKAMLRSRAITAGLKSVGFDPTAGVYDYGEIGGPEPVLTEEPIEVVDKPESTEAPEEDADVKAAIAELEELLAEDSLLTTDQRIYVREHLSDGSDPVSLLNAVKLRLYNQKAKA